MWDDLKMDDDYNWLSDPEVSFFDTIPSTTFIGFNSTELGTTLNTQAFQEGGNFARAVETGSIAQNLAAEPGFLSTPEGVGMVGDMVGASINAIAEANWARKGQDKLSELPEKTQERIRNKAAVKHGIKKKKKKR